MSSRVSRYILLCEDRSQKRLVEHYFNRCGINKRIVSFVVASEKQHGGNVGWVLQEFPRELCACRQRAKKAQTLLIVVIDADDRTVDRRKNELVESVSSHESPAFTSDDPVAVLIPRRNIETWILALLGRTVNEDEDYGRHSQFSRNDFITAARNTYDWSRENASPESTCVPSLISAFPEWRKIG